MNSKGGLGRGLSSLIPKKRDEAQVAPKNPPGTVVETFAPGERVLHISVRDIVPNPHQPRRDFRAEELAELASSIKEFGILQPLILSEKVNGMFELIAGERRLRAAEQAGLDKVPAIIRSASEQQKLELALIENIQRSDLSPIEEGRAYAKLMEEFGLTQEKVAERVGKSRPVVANTLRLLNLPDDIQRALSDGRISASMARVLCGMDRPSEQRAMFERMLKGEFTVREAEDVSRLRKGGAGVKSANRDVNLLAMEEELRAALGTKVTIKKRGGQGKIVIDFYSEEELGELTRRLKH